MLNGIGLTMDIFPTFFFFGNIDQENVFYHILDQEKPFWAIKIRSSNRRKINIFPKGLTHGFGPKMAVFLFELYVFWPRKAFLRSRIS